LSAEQIRTDVADKIFKVLFVSDLISQKSVHACVSFCFLFMFISDHKDP